MSQQDVSDVFRPEPLNKFVSSPKYAPLESLPSQQLSPVNLPMDAVYKPSWQYGHGQPPGVADKMTLAGSVMSQGGR